MKDISKIMSERCCHGKSIEAVQLQKSVLALKNIKSLI